MNIVESFAPPTNEIAIAALEKRIGGRLPEEYRAFLLRDNGGGPDADCFRFADRKGPYTDGKLRAFYAIWDGKHSRMSHAVETFWEGERIPRELLPIGYDSFGNQICIAFAGPHRGRVYFWDHERETDPASYANLDRIADSFDAFCALLTAA